MALSSRFEALNAQSQTQDTTASGRMTTNPKALEARNCLV